MQDYSEPKVGDLAPNFRLPSTEGRDLSLSDFKGKNVILYFYPKDDTPGCTSEACGFRDTSADWAGANAEVLGVSTDSLESHEKFRQKYDLKFPLLSDQTSDIAKMYGTWKEKNLYGRRSWGVARTTFWIGTDGRVRKIYKKISPESHATDILRDLKSGK